ncbi:MAG: amidohydrolase [Acidobacteria bacterium]|nr:MAG: amidohydrolase [Acidobacteriota bacterium]
MNDAHCHFFSGGFFRAIGKSLPDVKGDAALELPARLGWTAPGADEALADTWNTELERHNVGRAVLIASVAGDEAAVAAAARRHPNRFVGAFMFNPSTPDPDLRIEQAFANPHLRMACLFPAMHGVDLDDASTDAVFAAAQQHSRAVFVHCGLLSIGVRKKLGLPSPFDLRLGDPLAVAAMAAHYPQVPVIIPHFGAGLFREALMAASAAPNILLDTSSSNSWIKMHANLTLRDVFARALDVVGPGRLLFGTDSSFFPRGWQRGIFDDQQRALGDLGVSAEDQAKILCGNFDRVFNEHKPGG